MVLADALNQLVSPADVGKATHSPHGAKYVVDR